MCRRSAHYWNGSAIEEVLANRGAPPERRQQIVAEGFSRAFAAEERWLTRISEMPASGRRSWLYTRAWEGWNRKAGLPEAVR